MPEEHERHSLMGTKGERDSVGGHPPLARRAPLPGCPFCLHGTLVPSSREGTERGPCTDVCSMLPSGVTSVRGGTVLMLKKWR